MADPSPGSESDLTPDDGNRQRTRNRLYGRRLGHALRSSRQDLIDRRLPALRAPDAGPVRFDPKFSDVRMESGFGGGEHLAAQMAANPSVAFIGAEPFVNGLASLLAKVPAECDTRLLLWDKDARDLLPRIPAEYLQRFYLLFPDPWPKKRHHKRRFVSQESLALIHRVLRPGGELRVASDIADYVDWTMVEVLRHGGFDWPAASADDWRVPPADHVQTRYESKALKAGRAPAYLRFIRR